MAFIEVKGITKKFGGLTAVDNVDFEIEQGKITAIIGPNGAGKSTFFNLINGFHKPTSGQILFEGKDITKIPVHKGAHLGIARTFQTTHLFEQSTVIDNVIVGHRLRTKSNLFDAVFRTQRAAMAHAVHCDEECSALRRSKGASGTRYAKGSDLRRSLCCKFSQTALRGGGKGWADSFCKPPSCLAPWRVSTWAWILRHAQPRR